MKKKSLIDDTEVDPSEYYGYPILFPNVAIRKLLTLAKANENDIFYDLGSGWGQNIIVAIKEYNVKEAVGIEDEESRVTKSQSRLKSWDISNDKGRIIKGKYEKLIDGKLKGANLEEATIVFYGLSSEKSDINLDKFLKKLQDGCRLVYYYINGLIPEIMPIDDDFPFYLSVKPFDYTKSKLQWLQKVTNKQKSTLGNILSEEELWQEFRHDCDVEHVRDNVEEYQKRFEKLFKC